MIQIFYGTEILDTVPWKWDSVFKGRIKRKRFLVKSIVTAHVALSEASLHKKYKEIKSTTES